MKRLVLVAVLAGIGSSLVAWTAEIGAPSQSPAAQKNDPAIEQLAKDYEAAFNKRDVKAVMAFYTDDAVRLGMNNQILSGRAAIEQFYRDAFAGTPPTLTIRPPRTRMVAPDVAIADGTYELSDGGRGVYLLTAVRSGGRWRVASAVPVPDGPR